MKKRLLGVCLLFFMVLAGYAQSPLSIYSNHNQFYVQWEFTDTLNVTAFKAYIDTIPAPVLQAYEMPATARNTPITDFLEAGLINYVKITYVDTLGVEQLLGESSLQLMPAPVLDQVSITNDTTVAVSWFTHQGYDNFDRYRLDVSPNQGLYLDSVGFQYITLDTVVTMTFPDDGATYYYQVAALDTQQMAHLYSLESSFTMPDNLAPAIPEGLAAAVQLDGNINLAWDAIEYVPDFYTYYVYVDTVSGGGVLVDSTLLYDAGFTHYSIENLLLPDTFYIHLQAVDVHGNRSAASDEMVVYAQDLKAPAVPTGLTGIIGNESIHLRWADIERPADFYAYQVYATDGMDGVLGTTTATEYTFEGLFNNVPYYVYVTSLDINLNESEASEVLELIPVPVETEPNDSFSLAEPILMGMIGVIEAGDADYYLFSADTAVEYTFQIDNHDLDSGSSVTSARLAIFDFDQNLLAEDETSGLDNLPLGSFVADSVSTYYIRVDHPTPNESGHYHLVVKERRKDAHEPNDAFVTATVLSAKDTLSGLTIFDAADNDYFAYSASENEVLRLTASSTNIDLEILVFDADQNFLKKVDTQGFEEQVSLLAETSGLYYFMVASGEGAAGKTGDYDLLFEALPSSPLLGAIHLTEFNPELNVVAQDKGFIELYNATHSLIDLSGAEISGAVRFTFPMGYTLNARQRIVIAEPGNGFARYYGFQPDFEWSSGAFSLDNDVLRLLSDAGNLIANFYLFSDTLWQRDVENDRQYQTYELKHDSLDFNRGDNWQLSLVEGGTPRKQNSSPSTYVQDHFESNNSFETAVLVSSGEYQLSLSAKEEGGFADRWDWFKVRGLPTDTLKLSVDFVGQEMNASISLFSSDSTFLAYTTTANGQGELEYILSDASDLYVLVTAMEGEADYRLDVAFKYPAVALPYTNNFEDASGFWLGYHWEVLNIDNNRNEWEAAALEGSRNSTAATVSFNPRGNDDWLISPVLQLGERDFLSWKTKVQDIAGEQYQETFEVWIGDENAFLPEDFTRIDSFTISHTYYKTYYVDLRDYAHQSVKLAFRNISVNQHQQFIDDVRVETAPDMGIVKGRVTSDQGLPLEGCLVTIPSLNLETTTDGQGTFTLPDVFVGTQSLQVVKEGFQMANFHVLITKNDTLSRDITLLALQANTVAYTTGFEAGEDLGRVDSLESNNWQIGASFEFGDSTIQPTDQYFLQFGGEKGYESGTYLLKWQNKAYIDLHEYVSADLSFKINYDLLPESAVFIATLESKYHEPLFLDLDNDGARTSLDYFTGSSQGWQQVTVPINDYTGYHRGEGLVLSLEIISDDTLSQGFGVVIDDLQIIGAKGVPIEIVDSLVAESYHQGFVPLTWQAVDSVLDYNIYRKETAATTYEHIASVRATDYNDSTVVDGKAYDYYVTTEVTYGESNPSNIVHALVGEPDVVVVDFDLGIAGEYRQDFEGVSLPNIPNDWNETYSDKSHFNWITADSAASSDVRTVVIPAHGQFAFAEENFLPNEFDHQGNVMLETPWFTGDSVNTNFVLSFVSFSEVKGQLHLLVYRTGYQSDWQVLDTLKDTQGWEDFTYNITELVGTPSLVQFGFWYINPPSGSFAVENAWAIDDVLVAERPFGGVEGTVTNTLNAPIEGVMVEILEYGDTLFTDANGKYSSPNYFAGESITLRYSGWLEAEPVVEQITIAAHTKTVKDVQLAASLKSPELSFEYNEMGKSVLKWKEATVYQGANFTGDYIVLKGALPAQLSPVDTVQTLEWVDAAISKGDTAYYRLQARYDVATAKPSNRVRYATDYIALLDSVVYPNTIQLDFGDTVSSFQLVFQNTGLDNLSYDIFLEQDGIGLFPIESQEFFGNLFTNAVQELTIPIGITDYVEGSYSARLRVESNDVNQPVQIFPIQIILDQARGSLQGMLSNSQTKVPVADAVLVLDSDTLVSDFNGNYAFDKIPIGDHLLHIDHPAYLPYEASLSLKAHGDTLVWNPQLVPDLAYPEDLSVTDHQTHFTLEWSPLISPNANIPLSYRLYRSKEDQAFELLNTLDITDTSYQDFDAEIGVAYRYYITALYSLGESNHSAAEEAVIQNLPPSLNPIRQHTFAEDTTELVLLEASDPNQTELTYAITSFGNNITGEVVNKRTILLRPLKHFNGLDTVRLTVSDGVNEVSTTFPVLVTPVSDAPVFSYEPVETVNQNRAYRFDFSAIDPDGDELVYVVSQKPDWLVTDLSNKTLSGTPAKSDVGTHAVKIAVTDGVEDTVFLSYSLEVTDVNNAPMITFIPPETVLENDTVRLHILATDIDGDTLTLTALKIPDWVQIDTLNHTLLGVPEHSEVGFWDFAVQVSDGRGGIDVLEFQIQVINVDQQVEFISEPVALVVAGQSYNYQVRARDPDGLTVASVTALDLPVWLTFDEATMKLSGVPASTDVGVHQVVLTATDGTTEAVNQIFTVTVRRENHAPTFTSSPDAKAKTASVNELYQYPITVQDADQDELVVSITEGAEWLSLVEEKGYWLLSGVPTQADIGELIVVLSVTDGLADTVNQVFLLEVSASVTAVDPLVGEESWLSVYPIPAQDQLTVSFAEEGVLGVVLVIHSMEGKQLYSTEISNQSRVEIDVSNWDPGAYILQVTHEQHTQFIKILID